MLHRTPRPIDAHIGKKIRERRKALNFTQKQLARLLHITSQQLGKYEAGKDKISPHRLIQLCQLLSVTPNYFFDGVEGISFSFTEDSIWLSCENLKGEKVQLLMGPLQGTVLAVKVSPAEIKQ